jgi:hypothetical protein
LGLCIKNEKFSAYIFPTVKDKNLFINIYSLKSWIFIFDTDQAEIYSDGFTAYIFPIVKDKKDKNLS